jgi:Flp pilus assembly protein TadG
MFIFGMLEMTRYIYVEHSVQMIAYEAARAGVVPGATNTDVETRANNLLQATGIRLADVTVTPASINNLTEEVSVNVSCDFSQNSWIPPTFLTNRTISTTISLQHENMAYLQPGDTDLESVIGNNDAEPLDE